MVYRSDPSVFTDKSQSVWIIHTGPCIPSVAERLDADSSDKLPSFETRLTGNTRNTRQNVYELPGPSRNLHTNESNSRWSGIFPDFLLMCTECGCIQVNSVHHHKRDPPVLWRWKDLKPGIFKQWVVSRMYLLGNKDQAINSLISHSPPGWGIMFSWN